MADTRDATKCQLKIYTAVTTEAEDTEDYANYMDCVLGGATGLVDSNGAYLIDDAGNYLVVEGE